MGVELQEMINFHLTGKRGDADAATLQVSDAVPALLAPYRDLGELRYDYPLILIDGADTQAYVDTLTGVINRLLRDIAPRGDSGAQLRQHILRLEQRMRELAADVSTVTLSELWKQAEKSLLAECAEAEAEWLGNSIATARFALRIDGQVVDCDERMPARLFEHAWAKLTSRRQTIPARINRIIIKLRDILKVDDLKNSASRTPQKIKSTLGKCYKEAFDFERMAQLLDDSTPDNRLPAVRRHRIRAALSVLESQRFFASESYDFVFDDLAGALKAYNERLPELAEVVRAISIADLELDNAYREDKHGAYFERFGTQALTPEDIAQFPCYLICLHESECNTRDLARLMEIVTCDMPMKVLIQVNDPLGEPSTVDGLPHQGSFVQQLVHTFVAGDVYVLQSPASNLYQQKQQIQKGLEFAGPAIFSVFVPRPEVTGDLPAYLISAAAMESRVFPAFSYDPAAGEGLADRFDISRNPDVAADWPSRQLRYEDEELQSVAEDVAFTLVDFAVTNSKYGDHFAAAAKDTWGEELTDVVAYLDQGDSDSIDTVPSVPVIGSDNVLRRLVVDEKLIRIARRCCERWHSLQELGGVNNSYAIRAHAESVAETEEEIESPLDEEALLPDSQAEPEPELEVEPDAARSPDDAYIDTPRCTTCDECTDKNDRMFAYDDNKQAYIKDINAGTYRELVEAAEICQVAIIHPGKPFNADEPGLTELLDRAGPFNS